VFNILEECIIMAAGLSSKNIFTSPYQKKLLAYQVKMQWAEGSFSDPITILNAYQVYKNSERQEHFKRSGESERMREKNWAHANFIQLKALKVIIAKRKKFRNFSYPLYPSTLAIGDGYLGERNQIPSTFHRY
jgi:ATP-dependent RNA helicase TDRD9